IVVKVNAGTANGTVISNTATVNTTTSDTNPGNNTSTTTTTVGVPAQGPTSVPGPSITDPVITKLADLQLVQPGEKVTFTITVSNPSQSPIPGVSVVDPIPAPLQYIGATTSQGTFTVNGNTLTFNIGTLNPASSVVIKVVTLVPSSVVPPMDI